MNGPVPIGLLCGFTGLEQLVGVLGRVDRVERHGDVPQKRRLGVVEGDLDGHVVNFVDALEQVFKAHAFKVGVADQGKFVPRVIRVQLALKAPEHIIGIEGAGRFEIVGAVELHAGAQVEGVFESVGADVPAFGQGRFYIGGSGGEVDQAVEHGFRRGVGRHGSGVLNDIKPFRAGFGADHQVFRRNTDRCTEQCHSKSGA